MAQRAIGYGVEDLDWLRSQLRVPKVELDPWGSLVVTPASDRHEIAVALLADQAVRQLNLPPGHVFTGLPWEVTSGSGYVNVPDLMVLDAGWSRAGDADLAPPPLLVVEVASPSTRRADRGHKLDDYRLGGAALYVLVDLPAAPDADAGFEVHDFKSAPRTAHNAVDLEVRGQLLRFDLSGLAENLG